MKRIIVKQFKKHGVVSAIIFIIALIVSNFCLYMFNRTTFYKSMEAKMEVASVEQNLEHLWNQVQLADLGIRGFLLVHEESMAVPLNQANGEYMKAFIALESLLIKQHFDVSALATYKLQFIAKMEETLLMKQLQDEGKQEEAIAILKLDTGFALWNIYSPLKDKVLAFEKKIKDQAERDYQSSLSNTMILQVILLVLSISALALILFRLKPNARLRKELFQNLNQSNQQYLFCASAESTENVTDKKVIADLIDNLKVASDFVKNITKGNYEVQWAGISHANQHLNTNNLAGDMIQMREQMKKVKQEDHKRLWSNEGYAKFADLLRFQDDSFEEKMSVFLSELVKYIKATQGALFTVSEENSQETVLEMRTCYAYSRKKHLKKTIFAGEGLVGQAFQEGDIIFLTDIPADYMEITSGLGNASPNSVLIVPLKNNEKIVGILEIASFRIFEEYEISFISKLLESLAATLVSASVNERTKQLLQESQQKAEEMRAQEEEMRQNMEELSATQEEMHRKEQEYLSIIESLDSKKIMLTK
ncbi:MAG: GAF domain-containing protein [Bacteroidota bacterium]